MKHIILIIGAGILNSLLLAQDPFAGYRTGNNTGVTGVFFNPSNVVGTRYTTDINLFGISAAMQNNAISFDFKSIDKLKSIDSLLGEATVPVKAITNIAVLGPSFMFNINSKTSFGITSQARVVVNISDFDGKLLKSIQDNANSDSEFPYTVQSNRNQTLSVNAWKSFGVTLGRIIKDEGRHFFRAGITLKYVSGVSNAYLNVDNINGTINEDNVADRIYMVNTSGSISLGVGGLNVDNFEASDLMNFKGSGLGGDIGAIYEYRPDSTLRTKSGQVKYKFKAGIALLDLGSVSYTPDEKYTGGYNIHIGNTPYYLDNLEGGISEIKQQLDASSANFTSTGVANEKYAVSLPTILQLEADYNIKNDFYVNATGVLSLAGRSKYKNPNSSSSFTITPRLEKKSFGAFLPLSVNSISGFNAGIALRAGPLYIGSGSGITALLGNSKQADVFIGFRFGFERKAPRKM